MADSINVTAPLINAGRGDADLQPVVINLTPEDQKTVKTSDGHRDLTDERHGESVDGVASSSGPSDRDEEVSVRGRQTPEDFHQQAEAEEMQSKGHKIRDWLCEIVNILDADEISINRFCLKLQKEKSKDESVDDEAPSSGTSNGDDPDAFHQQAEESQFEDQSKRELLREIIKRVEADKISMSHTLSNLEVNRVMLLQFLTDIKKCKGLLNGQLEEQNAFDVTALLNNADGGDVDLQPAAEEAEEAEEEMQFEDHGNVAQNDIREELHQIVKRFHAQVHDRSYLTKIKEIRAIWIQILMELNELKGSPGAPVA